MVMTNRMLAAVAVATVALGCEPQWAASAHTESSATASAPDTIVYRVLRVSRRAVAMQRVTGLVEARQALQPLDSMLVVRVFDQRRRVMSGVPVRWSLEDAGEGAALRVLNARTDALGLSRAEFTPGRSARAQSAVAELVDVGRLDFSVTIPAASVRIVPDRVVLWAGDDAIVGAELRDAGGNVLPGGALFWGVTDTSVIRLVSEDASSARITGALAGTTTLVASTGDGGARTSGTVTVVPVVVGQFVTLDGRPPPEMLLELHAAGARQSIRAPNGAFMSRVELRPEQDIEIRATPLSERAAFHEVHLRIGSLRQLQNLRIALVPTVVRIESGTFAGREVNIDASRAMRRAGQTAGFYRLVPISGRGPRKLLGWRHSDYPLRIAFNRARSREPVTAEDSSAFWAIAARMQRDLGMALFTPAEWQGDAHPTNLVPVEISAQSSEAHTFVSWAAAGDVNDGVLLFRRASTLRDPHVVTHELAHLLGFGHASGSATVSQPVGGTQPRLTPEDVAYIQLAMRLRALQQETGALPGLPAPAP